MYFIIHYLSQHSKPDTQIFFFQRRYIPGWGMTLTSYRNSSLHSALFLQFLHPTRATSSCNSSHDINFGLPLFLLSPIPPGLAQRIFLAGSLSSILITCPAHLSLLSLIKYTQISKKNRYSDQESSLEHHDYKHKPLRAQPQPPLHQCMTSYRKCTDTSVIEFLW